MKKISVSNVQEYNINGKVVIRFNPMDTGFVKRFLAACEELAKRQEAFGKEAEEAPADNFFPVAEKADTDMREIINGLFGEDVCKPIFGEMHLTALSDGLPVWCNLMLAFMDEITETVEEVKGGKAEVNPKLKKYLSKFDKK